MVSRHGSSHALGDVRRVAAEARVQRSRARRAPPVRARRAPSRSASAPSASTMIRPTSRKSSSSNPRIVAAWRADADARRDRRRPLVERDGVAVRRQPDVVQPLLGVLARPLRRAEVELEQVRVGAAGEEVEPAGEQRLGERVGVRAHLPLVARGTPRGAAIWKHVAFAAITCSSGPPCSPGKMARSIAVRVLLAAEDEPGAGAGERLVRRRGDDVAVLDRVRVEPGGDEPGEVRHVAPEERADLVGDPPEHRRCRRCGDTPSRRRG